MSNVWTKFRLWDKGRLLARINASEVLCQKAQEVQAVFILHDIMLSDTCLYQNSFLGLYGSAVQSQKTVCHA